MPYVFVVPPDSGIGSLKDAVAQARANPGKLSWGFGGNATLGHFLGMALEDAAGVKGNPVAYRGGPDLLTALDGRHVDMVIMTVWPSPARPSARRSGAVPWNVFHLALAHAARYRAGLRFQENRHDRHD